MKHLRLILIGREPAAATTLGAQLTRLGHELVAATLRLAEATTLARRLRADLILVDLAWAGPLHATALSIQESANRPVVLLAPPAPAPGPVDSAADPLLPRLDEPVSDAELQHTLLLARRLHSAERTIRDQAEQIQAMQLVTTDTFWLVDAGGIIRDCNDAACRLTGYARSELVGMPWRLLEPGLPADQVPAGLVTTTPGVPGEREWRRKDGRTCTVELTLRSLGGSGRLYCGLARDITARRAAADRFRQLTRAVEQCPTAIVITDTTGTIQYVNPFFEKVTGYSAAEAVGQNPRVLKSGRQDRAFYEELWATLRRGETWTGDFHNRRKDGSFFWERASISPMRDPDGTITHYVAVKEDVTAARQARRELERARDEAEAANRAKDAFLATMSHELRTPLNVINGAATTLLAEPLPPRVAEALTLSLQSGQHLLSLIEELLDFSALRSGPLRLDAEPVDLVPLLEQVLRQVAELPAARALELTLTVDPAVPAWIIGDARRLRQVLLNLLANAVKFTARGAVHLLVRPQLGSPARPGLHCSVVDTGPGIADAHRERIFQPFTQADETVARRFGGTGLGLTISRSYVELMGGQLRVRSRLGVGSAFHFTFAAEPVTPAGQAGSASREIRRRVLAAPRVAAPVTPAPAPGPALATLAKAIPLTVLAADDVPTNRYVVEMALNHFGYTCRLVKNGAEAVEALQSAYFDLVLLDVQMPVMDGIEAAAEICRLYPEPTHRPKLVALTANSLATNRDACLAAGMVDFLTKPLLPLAVEACIRRHFGAGAIVPPAEPVQPEPYPEPADSDWINAYQLRSLTLGLPDAARASMLQNMHAFTREDYRTAFAQVQAACAQRNGAELRTVAHGLKGCFLTLGWDRVAALCRVTLDAIQAGTFAEWESFPHELQRRFEASDAAMSQFLTSPPPLVPADHACL